MDGPENETGMVYRVRTDAPAPFDTEVGKEVVAIQATPVFNSPLVINYEVLGEELANKIVEHFTSDDVAKNPIYSSLRMPKYAACTSNPPVKRDLLRWTTPGTKSKPVLFAIIYTVLS